MNKANPSANDSDTRSKQQKILSMLGLMTSKVLGENTFAKSSIYSERITRGLRSFLPKPLLPSASLAEFKMSKEIQMGYLVAAKDLKDVTIDQFNYMSLWATEDSDSSVVDRAAGMNFSEYLSQSKTPDKFVVGYKTAVIQFVRAIAGTGGVVFRINSALQKLDLNQQNDLVNKWFNQVNSYMNGASPFKPINNETKKASDSDEAIAAGVSKEINDGYLNNHPVGDSQKSLLENYSYNEDDFTDEHDLPKMMTDSIGKVSLSGDINAFVNNTLSGMLNALASLGLYALVYQDFNPANPDLVGAPATDSIDQETVISQTRTAILKVGRYFDLPKSCADLADKLGVLDLSNAGSARNAKHQNYRLRYSRVLEKDQPAVNDRGETVKVSYGIFETTHHILQNSFLLPLMVQYTTIRNQLLQQIADGQYTTSRNVSKPNFDLVDNLLEYVDALARYQIDQLMGLVERGQKDYEGLSQAGTFSAFSHLMRVAPEVKAVNPAYADMTKATKHLYYWLYQSSFKDSLPDDEHAKI